MWAPRHQLYQIEKSDGQPSKAKAMLVTKAATKKPELRGWVALGHRTTEMVTTLYFKLKRGKSLMPALEMQSA